MKYFHIFCLLIFIHLGFSQQNAQTTALDNMILQGIEDWNIPGLATVVVKDGEVVFQKTYGVTNVETAQKVDDNTLFNMASTTKAMVAMAMGILVDQNKVDWDDKVIEHLPSFQLSDPYITADAQIKDLFTHNLGIGNADYLWGLDSLSTKETLQKFSKADKIYPLRGGFVYQNIMYAVAGEVIKEVSGQHWADFIHEHLFTPLNMKRTIARSADILIAGNYANPHYNDLEGKAYKVHHKFSDQIGPAGMIWSNLNDISNYLKFVTNNGVYENDTIIKTETFKFLFEPQTILPPEATYPTNSLTQPNFNTYAMGWFQQDYRGKKLNFHTGSLLGLIAIAGVILEDNLAVYVFANMDHAELRHAILYKAIDLFSFNDNSRNWHQEVWDLYVPSREDQKNQYQRLEKSRIANTKPTLQLKEYTGTFTNKHLGKVEIKFNNGSLSYNLNNISEGNLQHYHYDTFLIEDLNKYENKLLIDFNLNQWGDISDLNFLGETFTR